MDRREPQDVVAILELLEREVAPLWRSGTSKLLAEELLSGLATGLVPDEFAEAHMMAQTGWSWETLQETPADVVERMATYLAVREAREIGGTLDLSEERHD